MTQAGRIFRHSLLLVVLTAGCGRIRSNDPTNICEAAAQGNLGAVEAFARQQPPSVEAADVITGHTPLELAIIHRHLSIARWLLRHGADPNAKHGRPLFIAAWGLDFRAVLMLLRAGANPDPVISGHTRLLESPGRAGLPDYLLRERIILWYLRRQAALENHETGGVRRPSTVPGSRAG